MTGICISKKELHKGSNKQSNEGKFCMGYAGSLSDFMDQGSSNPLLVRYKF